MPISDLLASVTAAVLLYRQLHEFKRHKINQI
jgi:hypothetical protein